MTQLPEIGSREASASAVAAPTAGFSLSARLRKRGSALLYAQCWAWGQDIQHPGGNLLLRYGFERLRPPAGLSGCSQYTLLQDDLTVRLWGFGVYVGNTRGTYLNRYEFVPRSAERVDAWAPAQVGYGSRLRDPGHLLAFLRWASGYETWVEGLVGRPYRQAVLRDMGRRHGHVLDLAVDWLRFEQAIHMLVTPGTGLSRPLRSAPAGPAQEEGTP